MIAVLSLSYIQIFAMRFCGVEEFQGAFKLLSEDFSQCRA